MIKMKEEIISNISKILSVEPSTIKVEYPKDRSLGDYAVPCFQFAKELHKSPMDIANDLKEKLPYKTDVVNGYLNIFMNKNTVSKNTISKEVELFKELV